MDTEACAVARSTAWRKGSTSASPWRRWIPPSPPASATLMFASARPSCSLRPGRRARAPQSLLRLSATSHRHAVSAARQHPNCNRIAVHMVTGMLNTVGRVTATIARLEHYCSQFSAKRYSLGTAAGRYRHQDDECAHHDASRGEANDDPRPVLHMRLQVSGV